MFSWLFRAEGGDDRSPYGDFWFEPVTVRSSAGTRVSVDGALRLSVVYRCVRVLAGTMASLPLCFYREKAEGKGRDPITDHWLYRLLTRRPNRWQNAFEWHAMMQGHLALRGNAYNRIILAGGGKIAELLPLHPDRMKIELLDDANYRYRYRQPDGSDEILPPGAVFKLSGLSSNGLTGMNPIELARESVGEGLAQQDYSSRFFANDARPSGGWIEMQPGQTFKDTDARTAFRDSWQKAQAGANRGKTAVLEGGMKYHELVVNNRDAQFLEAKNAKVPDICRWFGVPPHLAFALDRATDNNIERLSLEFIKFTMTEWAELWEAAIEDQLLVEDDGIEIEYDMDNLARGEMKTRAEYYNLGINGGWLTRNEARGKEGLNPLPELDEPLQPLNMVPAGTEPEPQPDPQPDPAPADDATDARLMAITRAVSERVVRKELAAVAKLAKALALEPQYREFYDKHRAYVQESFGCAEEFAAAWCEARFAELKDSQDIAITLKAWETTSAAELAARLGVQTSGQEQMAASLGALAKAVAAQPAPVTHIKVDGTTVNNSMPAQQAPVVNNTVNVPEQPAPVVHNKLEVRGFPMETKETIARRPDGEIDEITRRVTKE